MKDIFIVGLLIIIFGLVTANIILLNQRNDVEDNTIFECNLDTSNLSEQLDNAKTDLKQDIFNYRSTCNPTYHLELPEDRDKLYITLDYVANARDYVLDEYDCTEKAELLVILLKEQGFTRVKTKFVNVDCNKWNYGEDYTLEDCKSNNGGHLIVELGSGVYIEATSGRFIMPEDYDKYGLK